MQLFKNHVYMVYVFLKILNHIMYTNDYPCYLPKSQRLIALHS